MSFTHKNLQHGSRSGITFLKGATFFFLGMSCVLFLTQAFEVIPSMKNTRQFIQEIIFTTDGYDDSTRTISIDGSGGNASFAGTLTGGVFCLEEDSCITTWPEGGGDSVWSTGTSKIYYTGGSVGIGTHIPGAKLQVDGTVKFRSVDDITGAFIILDESNGTYVMNVDTLNRKLIFDSYNEYKVGIGTDDPSQKLEVDGNIRLTNSGYIQAGINSNQVYLGTNGNVGIGTDTPASKLTIGGVGNGQDFLRLTPSNGGSGWGLYNIYNTTGTQLGIRYGLNGLPVISFGKNTNVNIGGWLDNNSPYTLAVSGAGQFSSGLIVGGTANIGNNLRLSTVGSQGNITSAARLFLNVSGSQQAVIIDTDKNMTVKGNVTATAFYYDSDERLKTDISTIVNPLQKILSLSGYNFTWIKDGRQDIGVIAQEVEKVFPEIVQTNAEGYKSVEYGNLVAPLIEAIKELNAKIDRQAQEIAILKASIQ